MDAVEFLRALRRRWVIIAAAIIVAMAAAWATTSVAPTGPPVKTYRATTVLFNTGQVGFGGVATGTYTNLKTIAALTTVGEVPQRVAEVVADGRTPQDLARMIRASANQETGLLRISATSTNPDEAKVLADTFATELITFLGDRRIATTSRQLGSVERRLDRLRDEIGSLDRQIESAGETQASLLTAERDAKVTQYQLLYQQYSQLGNATIADLGDLQIIQDAVPVEVTVTPFIQVRSLPSRLALAGFLGLLAGAGLVFVLERLDTRLRSKEAAERAFELPVLAEIPVLGKDQRRAGVVTASRPRSAAADAYRILAASILRRPATVPQVIVVTSPGPNDGKTTVVANLSAAFAEIGRRVLLISSDLHRPQLHRLMGIPNTQGLSELLRSRDPTPLVDGYVWKSDIERVRVIPSGANPEKPAELLASAQMAQLLRQAREVADIVLLDTPPILAASDAASLLPEADAVVVVARAGKTSAEVAGRTTELLASLNAPVLGVALNGVTEALPRGYYQYYQYYRRRQKDERPVSDDGWGAVPKRESREAGTPAAGRLREDAVAQPRRGDGG